MRLSKSFFRKLVVSTAALFMAASVMAQQPSAAQIEQFKALPKAQQEALAKQYGIDISQLGNIGTADRLQDEAVMPLKQGNDRQPSFTERVSTTRPEGLQRFGANLFDANVSTFAPVANAPVPENYRLGPDDTLLLQLYGKQNDNLELVVNREGNVNLPDLGPVNVAGLTFLQASNLIRTRLTEANIGLQAAVTMGQLRTINIFVAGEAKNPGMYAVSALTSVTQALFVSGGVSEIGSLRNIRVTRNGQIVSSFDLYDLLLNGQNKNDILLQHGDVLFISPVGKVVTIEGEVRRPAHYELAADDNLSTLVKMAGGLQPGAQTNALSLQRATAAGRELLTIDFNNSQQQQLSLVTGDRILVPEQPNRIHEQITLAGAVARPGHVAWRSGLHLHQVISNSWSDLLNTTDTDYALLIRKQNIRGDVVVMQFNLAEALAYNQQTPAKPVLLQPQDIVVVFNQANASYQRESLNAFIRRGVQEHLAQLANNTLLSGDIAANNFRNIEARTAVIGASQFATESQDVSAESIIENFVANMLSQIYVDSKYIEFSKHLTRRELLFPLLQQLRKQSNNLQAIPVVSISGDVKVPGEYPLTSNASVSALLIAAGGLTNSAYLNRAELSRFSGQQVQQSGMTQQNININLAEMLNNPKADLALQSRDRLNVLSIPDWSKIRLVNLQGEVKFPGTYQVIKGEKLSDVIQRAGGFTENAYPYGAVFTRNNIKAREKQQAERLLAQLKADIASKALTNTNALGAAASPPLALINELQTIEPVGRLVIDLEQIMLGRADFDIEMEDGDALFVPRTQNSVTVMGEVQHPGSHRFRAGMNVNDYLALAGGSRKRADEKRVFVIRADGSVMVPTQNRWFGTANNDLKPGDTIIMPLDTEYKDGLSMWAQVTQIFYQTAVAIAALNSF